MDREAAEPQVDGFPGKRAAEWSAYQREVAAPSTHLYDFVWDTLADAAGPFCTDIDGNVLLDFTCHVASAPLGYNNQKIQDRLAEFDLVDPGKIAGQDFFAASGYPPGDTPFPGPGELMHRVTELTSRYALDTVFLTNSGAEAIENAIKICYDYRDGAAYGITFDGAFHGRTLGALSLNRSKAVHRRQFPDLPGIHDMPYCTDRDCTADSCRCGFFPDGAPSRLRRRLDSRRGDLDPSEVAYIIIEPIQGEGGYRIPSQAFMNEIASLCKEYEIPLIADEIQSGMGRTGEWWGSDLYDIEPDVITVAKSLRVGATVARDEIFPDTAARISSTWGAGDLIASLQGVLTIDAIREHELRENATAMGEEFVRQLEEIDAQAAGIVDVRGRGLMVGVEFDSKDRRDAVIECCLRRGFLTLPCGVKTLRLLPPLDVTEREITMGTRLLEDALGDPEVQEADPQIARVDEAS